MNSHQAIDAETVKLKLRPFHSGGSCPFSVVKPYVRKGINVGSEVFDAESLQVHYPHSESIPLKKYIYGDVQMVLGQDNFHSIRPLEFLKPTEILLQ